MIPAPLLTVEIALRHAVEMEQFEEAARLGTRYCEIASQHIASLPEPGVGARETAMRVRDVLAWSELSLLAARGAIADQLTPLSRYLKPDDPRAKVVIEA